MLRVFPVSAAVGAQDLRQNGSQLVIVTPPGSDLPSAWTDPTVLWLKTIAGNLGAQMRELVYSQTSKPLTTVQQCFFDAQSLVDALEGIHTSVKDSRGNPQPLLLLGFGIGGYTLINALCIFRARIFQYRSIVETISAVVFLGVPNLSKSLESTETTLKHMIRAQSPKLKSLKRKLVPADVQGVVDICKQFQLVPITVPVVSLFETRQTIIQKPRLIGVKRVHVLVASRELCQFHKDETLLSLDADHLGINEIKVSSDTFDKLLKILQSAVKEASTRLAKKDLNYTTPSELQGQTLRTETAYEQADGDGIDVSNGIGLLSPLHEPSTQVSPAGGTNGSSNDTTSFVPTATAFQVSQRKLNLPYFSLGTHQQSKDFFARRNVLAEIDRVLLPNSPQDTDAQDTLRSFAICGLGGIGKTELAVEYACTRRENFEAVFWLLADDKMILAENFARIAKSLGLEDESSDLAASRELVKGWLAAPVRHTASNNAEVGDVNWLLIFDDVDDVDILPDYWPSHGRGSVLITSRDPRAKDDAYTARHGVDLPLFSHDETVAFLQRTSQKRAQGSSLKAASDIAESIQGLPLAVKQIGAAIRESRMTYVEFYNFYERQGYQRLRDINKHSRDPSNDRPLAILWALNELPSKAATLLQVLSLLHHDKVPESIVRSEPTNHPSSDYPRGVLDYYAARAKLLQSSLVSQNEEKESLSVYRLVQESTRSLMDDETTLDRYRMAFALVSTQWPWADLEQLYETPRYERCAEIFPSILKLKTGLERICEQNTSLKIDPSIAKLLNDSGWYLNERGNPGESTSFFRFALSICNRLDASDFESDEVQAIFRNSHCFLACAESDTNNYMAATPHIQKWLELVEKRVDDNGAQVIDFELGVAYNEVGGNFADNEDFQKAESYMTRAINIMKQSTDFQPDWLGWPQPNLGLVLWIQGKFQEAKVVLEEILGIFARDNGYDDVRSFRTGKMLFALGNVFESLNESEKSLELHHRALKQYTATLGPTHFRTGDVCYKLAGHYIRMSMYTDAATFIRQALIAFESKVYLKQQLARASFRQSELLRLTGKADEASVALDRACELRKQCVLYDGRLSQQLTYVDFDSLVNWMSR